MPSCKECIKQETKTVGSGHSKRHETLSIPSLLLRKALFSSSFHKDTDRQGDHTCSDSHEDPQIFGMTLSQPPLWGNERYMNDLIERVEWPKHQPRKTGAQRSPESETL